MTHPKSGCGSDWITHNTPNVTDHKSDQQGEAIEIFHRCFDFMWYFYGQRRREENKKALEGALKFFPGIKITPEQELCFQSRVV